MEKKEELSNPEEKFNNLKSEFDSIKKEIEELDILVTNLSQDEDNMELVKDWAMNGGGNLIKQGYLSEVETAIKNFETGGGEIKEVSLYEAEHWINKIKEQIEKHEIYSKLKALT